MVCPRFRQVLFGPCERQGEGGTLALQAAREFGDKGTGQRRPGACHVGDLDHQVAGPHRGGIGHLCRPARGGLLVGAVGADANADTPQVFDQRQAQHDRDGPQLAQIQDLFALVGCDEAAQRAAAESSVAMRDGLQCQVIDPRHRTTGLADARCGKPRQLAAVARRQMAPRDADFFGNQVLVVEQPFGSGRDRLPCSHCLGDQLPCAVQHTFIRREAGQQPVRSVP